MDLFRQLEGEEPHTESKIKCTWHKDEFYGAANAKKSVSAAMFILFLGYTMFVLLRQQKKETSVSWWAFSYSFKGWCKIPQNNQWACLRSHFLLHWCDFDPYFGTQGISSPPDLLLYWGHWGAGWSVRFGEGHTQQDCICRVVIYSVFALYHNIERQLVQIFPV